MQVFPGDPEVTITVAADIATDGFQVAEVHAGTHTGTHLDAPLHTVEGGASVDRIDLRRLVGRARIVRLPVVDPGYAFGWHDVESQLSEVTSVAMVLFQTGWSQHFGTGSHGGRGGNCAHVDRPPLYPQGRRVPARS
ncbi:cyclase family protein [Arthrobacter sp. H20]|uniref:cyclase family protein n=1 Tax=Arthrobacter sp. H20 TaxID=1267981 RepID=UPI0020A65109|nr:cyclase family protein [Arthrobacter sp. H20]